MDKTKLQEVCHKRQWGLPKYSAMKDGPDHTPCFKASVYVNGISFHSSASCKSSKDAHNDAAKMAFLHFTSPPPPTKFSLSLSLTPLLSGSFMIPGTLADGPETNETSQELDSHSSVSDPKNYALISSAEPNAGGQHVKETNQGSDVQSHSLGVKADTPLKYKSHLQNYARWKNCDLPTYSNTREGPSHAPCFKATDDSGFYKNALQELAQREDLSMPVYKIIKSGALHMPTFFSYVEIEGEKFYGKAGKSKKEAELKSARAAYTVLMERALNRNAESDPPNFSPDETLNSTPGLDMTTAVNLQQHLKQNGQLSSPVIVDEEHSAETKDIISLKSVPSLELHCRTYISGIMLITDAVQEVNFADPKSGNAKVGPEDSILSPSPEKPAIVEVIGNQESSSCSEYVPTSSPEGSSSSTWTHNSSSAPTTSDSNVRKATRPRSYLLCNRVRVYPCYPDIALPNGITVMPISDNQWVAVSLEFPMEQGY
ncbi:double-stranded RNA-binding protein 1-like [Populus trichocarpa]|uniref:double-stranded RNA-binding protein 1-like n=1 Tax=Populus trichocarpa TaxID=3694 RepID=UPI00227848A0|nr:double-stranded RNA-binding protein 1-like [Populus trichocarpa]